RSRALPAITVMLLGVSAVAPARADLMLTPEGVSQGFALSTFATNFPTFNGIGPLGITFPGTGVMVSDFAVNVRVFPSHADNQHGAAAPVGKNYGTNVPAGLTQAGGQFFMSTKNGTILKLNPDGSFNMTLTSGLPALQDI